MWRMHFSEMRSRRPYHSRVSVGWLSLHEDAIPLCAQKPVVLSMDGLVFRFALEEVLHVKPGHALATMPCSLLRSLIFCISIGSQPMSYVLHVVSQSVSPAPMTQAGSFERSCGQGTGAVQGRL